MSERTKDPSFELDKLDRTILQILQEDNKIPQRKIAEKIGLSAPAVQRRIRRLEDIGVIEANVALVDPTKVGLPITIFTQVTMESERLDLYESAKRLFASTPEVQQCYYVTGEADFLLIITCSSMADYEALTRRLFFENNNVKHFRTSVVMDRVKFGTAVLL